MSFGDADDDRIELTRQRARELAAEYRASLRALERIIQKGGLVVIVEKIRPDHNVSGRQADAVRLRDEEELMNTIWKVVEMLRGAMSPSDAADLVIAEIGRQAGIDESDFAALVRPDIEKVRAGSSYSVIQAAVAQIMAGPPEDLLRELAETEAASRSSELPTFDFSERLADFLWDATRVRVAFDAGLWLALLLAARLGATSGGSVSFVAINPATVARAMVLAKSLGLPLEVRRLSGYFTEAPEAFDLTYLLPPIGYRMKEPASIRAAIDALITGPGRATAETLAIGEILSSVPGRAVLLTGPGLAWRPAGVERQLRQDLVTSGLLAAAIQLPEGVVWNGTTMGGFLRDVYVRGKYRDVILPMVVLSALTPSEFDQAGGARGGSLPEGGDEGDRAGRRPPSGGFRLRLLQHQQVDAEADLLDRGQRPADPAGEH